jgi:hypothetical protein
MSPRDPSVLVEVPELADLPDAALKRLATDYLRKIMLRDQVTTVERLYWSKTESLAVNNAVYQAVLDEAHGRAWAEHLRRGFGVAGPDRAELNRRMAAAWAARAPRPNERRWWPTALGLAALRADKEDRS